MTIERNDDPFGFYVICDNCDYDESFDEYTASTFADVIKKIKEDGWKITKKGHDWMHYCPECQK